MVTILIPITHRVYAKGNKTVTAAGATVGEAFKYLHSDFPEMEGRVMAGETHLAPGMEVAVNGSLLLPFTADLKVNDGDEIRISSVITGG